MSLQNTIRSDGASEERSGLWKDWLARRLERFHSGTLFLELPDGTTVSHTGTHPGPNAQIQIRRWRFFWRLLSEGEVGLGRAYVDGDWATPDLLPVFAFGLANISNVTASTSGWKAAHWMNGLWHWLNTNTQRGSRRNIAAHYDLGNAFYEQWLDADLNYSSGIHLDEGDTLECAQRRKLDRIVELLDMKGGESVLEIGCGWGAMSRRLRSTDMARYTGITLSEEQHEFAQSEMARLVGNGNRPDSEQNIDFQLCDYRNVTGKFDRIVSIEMFEAVGERYWQVYFEKLASCLKEDGSALLQIITIDESVFETYRQRPDFIQQYIFPGGMLPTVSAVRNEASRAGFHVSEHQTFGKSYARTLSVWHDRFQKSWPDIARLGFDERFRRMWTYYLKYCEAGFEAGQVDVGIFKLTPRKPS